MTLQEAAALVGLKVAVPFGSNGNLRFHAVVKDARAAFGRVDLLIQPDAGIGECWVSSDAVVPEKRDKAGSPWRKAGL